MKIDSLYIICHTKNPRCYISLILLTRNCIGFFGIINTKLGLIFFLNIQGNYH